MFEVGRPILNFLLLVLGVLLNSAPDSVHEKLGVFKTFSNVAFKLDPRQGSFGCLVLSTLVLVPTKANLIIKERSCKRGAVGASGTGGSKMIFTLLAKVVALHVRFSIIKRAKVFNASTEAKNFSDAQRPVR